MASQLAATAVQHFNAGSYELALDQLGQIQQQKEDDPKLEHNNAVAQYYHSGCSEPDTILTALSAIKSRIEEHSADADAVYAEENDCLLYTSDAADEEDSVDLGGRRIIIKKSKGRYKNEYEND
eukprot:TRINITY_DN19253_c0_g1_i5.p1 TRINITY_DN19253_c0_g1~~TRINITY_DN19253_c0_g1_i5.p1  ORF type:complete len:124 (-),score=35.61 TRINITY_DN19253_c0_g1_i5:90-461(-)